MVAEGVFHIRAGTIEREVFDLHTGAARLNAEREFRIDKAVPGFIQEE